MRLLTIRKFAYLKTPLFSWSIENESGGSWSNSGMHKSKASLMRQIQAQYLGEVFTIQEITELGEQQITKGEN